MSKIKDETGKKYGYLTVIKRAPNGAKNQAMWECQCECGNKIIVDGYSLRRGATKSCGCYQKKRTSESCTINLVGKTIGNFTVLESLPIGYKGKHHAWRCRCNLCGNENFTTTTTHLYRQYSCGCSTESKGERKIKEILTDNNINFIQEKRFSDLKFPDTNKMARFDFYLPEYNTLIEYDGSQHFQVGRGRFDSPEQVKQTQERDKIKTKYAELKGIKLIRIPYWEYDNINLNMLLGKD